MQITQDGDKKFLTVGDIRIPVTELLTNLIDEIQGGDIKGKKVGGLTTTQHIAIIQDGGVTVPEGKEPYDLMLLALSFVQNAWLSATKANDIPLTEAVNDTQFSEEQRRSFKHYIEGHEGRVAKFIASIPKPAKAPKVPKAPKAPKVPGAPKEPKAPSAARISSRLYAINPEGDVAIAAKLTGFSKATYEALKTLGPDARSTQDQVIAQGIANGTVYGGKDGGKNQTAFQLKTLVTMNLALLFTASA